MPARGRYCLAGGRCPVAPGSPAAAAGGRVVVEEPVELRFDPVEVGGELVEGGLGLTAALGLLEGESEIVAGHMVEYSGMAFALFFLGEYANMIFLSCMAAIMFLGGWAAPILIAPLTWIPGWLWLGLKTFVVVSLFIWFRASFPRYRYDQIMRLGWKVFLPISLFWVVLTAGVLVAFGWAP